MSRNLQFEQWLAQRYAPRRFSFAPASEDASFRRYLRVTPENGPSVILMDAPPEHEDCRPYVEVARLFAGAGVHVPEVLTADLENGYLLLSDLGSETYLQALKDRRRAPALYDDATSALVRIQLASRAGVLPPYDRTLLLREMRLFPDWYIAKHLRVTLTAAQNTALDQIGRAHV